MKITWNWLAELIELELSLEEIAERLTMGGIEVEGTENVHSELAGVVCGRIESVEPHPAGERLNVCSVRIGELQTVRVVCGAPNVASGQVVPFAAPGTTLPGGRRIEATEIRGVASGGMLCSAAELGIGDDTSGLLLLPPQIEIGQSVAAGLGIADTVIEVSITPNRGDCLSVIGLAREIAALTGQSLRPSRLTAGEAAAAGGLIEVRVEDSDLCSRYVARSIDGVRIGPSPLLMQTRLRAIGMRPINNVVDATNYVMIERGQPLHAFDYDRLPAPEITVRRARPGESIVTLDGQPRQLEPADLLITSGGVPVAIAGVMGGENSEVTESTTRILLESAWFDPSSVRRTSKRLGLRSEASYRFERATDIAGVPLAAARAVELIATMAGGQAQAAQRDAYPQPVRPKAIGLRLARVEQLLG
ncbi:MAG TPA: phenylalanine--tRNA ligase subunit beta, partial [Terriglobales bacterium]|nr:phenylalanine--tRNA ligase subunit beta [Terriglobales bacterium]